MNRTTRLATTAIIGYLTPHWSQINSLTSKILEELVILEESAKNLNLREEFQIINAEITNLRSYSKLDGRKVKKAIFTIKEESLFILNNLFKNIRRELSSHSNESYEEWKGWIQSQDWAKNCNQYANKLLPKVSELEAYL